LAKRAKAPDFPNVQAECSRIIASAAASGRVCLDVYEEWDEWIAIRGDSKSLAFLGELLLAFARGKGPDTICLDSPEAGIFHPAARGKDGVLYAPSHGLNIYRTGKRARPMPRRTTRKARP
jgi:hypothetical protein